MPPTKEDIKKIKVWITEKGSEPASQNPSIIKNTTPSDTDKPYEFDIWADWISDGVEKKKVGDVSFTYSGEVPTDNKPPIANAGSDQTVKEKTVVTLNGSASSDPEGAALQYQWSQTSGDLVQLSNNNQVTTTFTAPEIKPVEPDKPKAVLLAPSQVKAFDNVTIDGSNSIADILEVKLLSSGVSIDLNEIAKWKWNFIAPDGNYQLQFEGKATKGASQSIIQISIQVTKQTPVEGEIDKFGQIWYHANGEQFLVKQSRDEATDDRWSGNVTGLRRGYESMMIAKSIGIGSGGHFASKLFGGNHSGSGASSQRWYDLGVRANGEIQLQWEGPHPSNHDFTLPDRCWFIKKLSKPLEGNWIGLKWFVYKLAGDNGSPSNGGVLVKMWVNEDPIGTDGKPKNENWKLALSFIDGKDVNVINPQSFSAPDEIDIEIRRSDTKNHEVYGGGQHVRRLGTYSPLPSSLVEEAVKESETEAKKEKYTFLAPEISPVESKQLTFQLKVTDDKGLSATDTVNVTVTKDDIPPICPPGQHYDPALGKCVPDTPQQCDPGYHWDPVLGKCVPDIPQPTNPVKIGHIGDTHGNQNGFKLLKTRENCDFVLHSGDFTDTEDDDDGYIQAIKDAGLQYGISCANSQGNHESSEEGGEGAQQDMENAFPTLKANKWLQFYHIKNVCIIIGNTQLSNYSQIDSETSKHIQQSLVKAKELKDQGKADWIIYMQHKPMWVIKNSGHSAEYNFRYVFHPLFDQYGVDFMFSGHTHIEQRTLPLIFPGEGTNLPPKVNSKMTEAGEHDFATVSPHGIICCPNGSSSKSHNLEENTNAWTAYAADDGNAYTVLEFNGKKVTGKFIDISSGAVRHEFKVSKEGGGPIEPVCPPGYHYDPVTKQCVKDTPEPGTTFKFNISGDFRDTPESGDNLVSDKPDLILSTGDYGIAEDPADWCNNIMKMWKDSGIPTYGARGNHDDDEYLDLGFFQNTGWEWSVKKGNILFVAADTIDENVDECELKIQAGQNDPEVKHIIVLMHEGIFHPPNTSVSSDTVLEFHTMFKKYNKVRVVLCGHTHVYGRMKPNTGDIDANILYIMNGIGGQSPTTGSTSPSPNHKINGALHCAILEDGSIKCSCVPNAGDAPNVMDTFTIGADGTLPTDGVQGERRD